MIRIDYIAPVLALGAVAIAVAAAPIASAAAGQACSDMGGATQCQNTGNVQIFAKPHALPSATSNPYGPFVGWHNGRN